MSEIEYLLNEASKDLQQCNKLTKEILSEVFDDIQSSLNNIEEEFEQCKNLAFYLDQNEYNFRFSFHENRSDLTFILESLNEDEGYKPYKISFNEILEKLSEGYEKHFLENIAKFFEEFSKKLYIAAEISENFE